MTYFDGDLCLPVFTRSRPGRRCEQLVMVHSTLLGKDSQERELALCDNQAFVLTKINRYKSVAFIQYSYGQYSALEVYIYALTFQALSPLPSPALVKYSVSHMSMGTCKARRVLSRRMGNAHDVQYDSCLRRPGRFFNLRRSPLGCRQEGR